MNQHDGAHGDYKDDESIVMLNSQGAFLASNSSKKQVSLDLDYECAESRTWILEVKLQTKI